MQDVRNRRLQLLRRESCRVMLLKSVSPHSGGCYSTTRGNRSIPPFEMWTEPRSALFEKNSQPCPG